jgi:hypothetical protein
MHIARKDVPEGSGLLQAKTGIQHSIILTEKFSGEARLLERLSLLAKIAIVQDLSISAFRDLVASFEEENYQPGEIV